ncbi:unnamed protein product [Lupinus luteus]|uniref:Uncharacterized protein n=1 Tax=Lupinus luteus TaxID=3873 RepID=A0AAV1VVW9_LUPLU
MAESIVLLFQAASSWLHIVQWGYKRVDKSNIHNPKRDIATLPIRIYEDRKAILDTGRDIVTPLNNFSEEENGVVGSGVSEESAVGSESSISPTQVKLRRSKVERCYKKEAQRIENSYLSRPFG